MPTLRDEAETLRLGLLMGLVHPEGIIAWADRGVAEEPTPPIELIDISLASGQPPDELARLLKIVPGPADLASVGFSISRYTPHRSRWRFPQLLRTKPTRTPFGFQTPVKPLLWFVDYGVGGSGTNGDRDRPWDECHSRSQANANVDNKWQCCGLSKLPPVA
jgi:hypothetical protein